MGNKYYREHDLLKELWYNRPWVYLPAVLKFMRENPVPKKHGCKLKTYIRNCFYINWQVAFKHHKHQPTYKECSVCLCCRCGNDKCRKRTCRLCDGLSKKSGNVGLFTMSCAQALIDEED